jgi:hypothetical protein
MDSSASVAPAGQTVSSADPTVADSATADPYLSSRPVSAKSIGHTSYVLKVRLENGLAAVFKPRSSAPLGDRRYKGEIAAYRLGRALGLTNLPVAIPGAFPASAIRRALSTPDAIDEFDRKATIERDGSLRGALMPWIEHYETLALESGEARARWELWLTDARAEVPEKDRPLARAISTMIAFDYVTANWDRWSGGNVARDTATGTVLFVDNDGAFYDAPPQASLSRQLALLRKITRFSRSFVGALRALDTVGLAEVMGHDLRGEPLLADHILRDVDARRRAVLEVVDAQIARAGESATLAFE